jgi:CRP/FNR family transcriptional regulator, cyclic AMP receptor protein
MDQKELESIPLFASLPENARRGLATWVNEVTVSAGKHLVDEGDYSYDLFVIQEGTADVVQDGERIAELGPGDFLGEMGIVGKARRNASVVATSPMSLIVMTEQAFRGMTRSMPAVADRIQQTVQERSQTLVC